MTGRGCVSRADQPSTIALALSRAVLPAGVIAIGPAQPVEQRSRTRPPAAYAVRRRAVLVGERALLRSAVVDTASCDAALVHLRDSEMLVEVCVSEDLEDIPDWLAGPRAVLVCDGA